MREFFHDIANFVLDFAFPKFCFGCQTEGSFLCEICKPSIPYLEVQFCIMCSKPSRGGLTHPKCATTITPNKTLSAFSYQTPPVKDMIIAGKYYFVPEIFKVLGDITTHMVQLSEPQEFYVICPLPLHTRRLRWRGFNQSEVFAKQIGNHLNIPVVNCLKRVRNTRTQKDLSQLARIKNVKDAFTIENAEAIQYKHVLLVDDVVTTGMTLRSASKVLKRAGATTVTCLTLARD